MSSATVFVSELRRAVNDIDRLSKQECSILLFRAANTLTDLRETADITPPANGNDAVRALRDLSKLVLLQKPADLATTLRNVAAVIEAAQMLIEQRKLH